MIDKLEKEVLILEIFSRIQQPFRWFFVNNKNIREMLSTPPYRQNSKIYALCPYCYNPVQIILKNSSHDNQGTYYAKHLKHSPFTNRGVNEERLNHCILRKKCRLMTKGAIPAELNLNDLDVSKIRKALYYLLHVSMSNSFVKKLLTETKEAVYYTDADEYNYPFMMLLEMKYLLLNNRRLAYYPNLIKAINEKSKYFVVTSSKHQVIAKDDNAKLYFVFNNQQINEKAQLNYIDISVLEVNKNEQYSAHISKFKVYIKAFSSLLDQKGLGENEDSAQ